MICISISQESRWFALVDMYNARSQCDLLEVRLDRLVRAADVGELLASKPKRVIMTCRRAEDGGDWLGMEEERLALLKYCIASKADYVEIELDIADHIPPSPDAKRVISYTNALETPDDLADIYARALTKHPDVIKLVVPARSPEEIWPVVQILARPPVSTVVVGLGKPGVMLAILARKMGAPWVYAALERGMEAYHAQPTVRDLDTVYHYRAIDRATRLIGVTGVSELQYLTVALLNTALAHTGQTARCLPLEIGNLQLFRRVLAALKLTGAVIGEEHRGTIQEIAAEQEPMAQLAGAVDVMVQQHSEWHGYNLLYRAAFAALEAAVRARAPGDEPLKGRTVLLAGTDSLLLVLATRLKRAGARLVLTSGDAFAGPQTAQTLRCPFVPVEAVHGTRHDVFILGEDAGLQTSMVLGHLKPGTTVLDLTALPRKSALLRDAEARGCNVVSPGQVLVELVVRQAKTLAGQEAPREPLVEVLNALVED
jgi:3-dehydroquinate dehydratase/shikimate dehydrogenase